MSKTEIFKYFSSTIEMEDLVKLDNSLEKVAFK